MEDGIQYHRNAQFRFVGWNGIAKPLRVRLGTTPLIVVGLALAQPLSAHGTGGFAIRDLTKLKAENFTFGKKKFTSISEPKRLTLACDGCNDLEGVDILLSKSTDGTEGRYRSGKTTIGDMEKQCQAREPNCTLEAVSINGAVGWVSRASLGTLSISTTVLFKQGDMLLIRSMAGDVTVAYENGKFAREKFGPLIVGP